MSASPRELPAWRELERHRDELAATHLRDLFAADPQRGERMVAEAADLYLDYGVDELRDAGADWAVESLAGELPL